MDGPCPVVGNKPIQVSDCSLKRQYAREARAYWGEDSRQEVTDHADAAAITLGIALCRGSLRADSTTQQTEGLRLRRGAKPQAVQKYDKASLRRIKGCVSGSKRLSVHRRQKASPVMAVPFLLNTTHNDGTYV